MAENEILIVILVLNVFSMIHKNIAFAIDGPTEVDWQNQYGNTIIVILHVFFFTKLEMIIRWFPQIFPK